MLQSDRYGGISQYDVMEVSLAGFTIGPVVTPPI
jgi:hypothetical protein